MRKLSDEARSLASSLWRPAGALGQALGRRGSWDLEAVQQLGSGGELAAVPHLAPVLFSDDPPARAVAAHAIKALLSLASVEDLPHLDESMRSGWYTETWRKLDSREIAVLVGPGQADATVLEVSSMHPNGFVREEALRRLALLTDGRELPYLLLRLNDWVAQVRQTAVEAVGRRITENYAKHFVDALFLIVRLERTRRADHLPILSGIYGVLNSQAARKPMLDVLRRGSPITRRASFRVLTRPPCGDLADVLVVAATAADSVIRFWATRSLATALDRDKLRAVLSQLLVDPSAPVRREALRAWTVAFTGESADLLQRALLDRSASVRTFVRFQLADKGEDWLRTFYREAVDRERSLHLAAAIAGLAEMGRSEDAAVIQSFLSHTTTAIRRTAVRYLIRVGGDEFVDRIFECLADSSRGVSNQARQAIQPYVARIGGPRLWHYFSEDRSLHVRRNALRLLSALPKWEALSYLIKATLDPVPSLSELARDYVVRWDAKYNQTQAAPTDAQLVEARAALALASEKLPSTTIESLSFSIRSFKTT